MNINNYWSKKLEKQSSILPELKDKLLYQAEKFSKLGIDSEESYLNYLITRKKMAYPRGDDFIQPDSPRNISKWMQALQQIYSLASNPGYDLSLALQIVTQSWDNMEQKDFKNWLNFYTEGAHQKYKLANFPISNLKTVLPAPAASVPNITDYQVHDPAYQEELRKQEVSKKIRSIIGRLNAAEKLATDPEVQKELQKKLDIGIVKWLEELQRVKRLIQVAPLRHASSTLLEDLIIKESNILLKRGFPAASIELRKLAQPIDPVQAPESGGNVENSTQSTSLPAGAPTDKEEGEEAMQEFIKEMNLDYSNLEDNNQIQDMEDDPLSSITVIAQEIPSVPNTKPAPVPPDPIKPLEVQEVPIFAPVNEEPKTSPSSNLLDAALNTVNISDIVLDLETLANILRTREMSRQLAIVDIKMDKLNISTFFPQLAEASSKILDANQYALTRIEEVLSKLRGAVKPVGGKELELTSEPVAPIENIPNVNPQVLRQQLNQQTQEEKARKEKRKQDQAATENKQLLEQPVPTELQQSTPVINTPSNAPVPNQ